MKLSNHALERYFQRTSKDPLLAGYFLREQIEEALEVDYDNLKKYGFKFRKFKNAKYYIWYEKAINENACGIVINNTMVTVLTENIYSYKQSNYRPAKKRII